MQMVDARVEKLFEKQQSMFREEMAGFMKQVASAMHGSSQGKEEKSKSVLNQAGSSAHVNVSGGEDGTSKKPAARSLSYHESERKCPKLRLSLSSMFSIAQCVGFLVDK